MEIVELNHEGLALSAELYAPEGAKALPGVLVMHNALGIGKQTRGVATELASLGYAALATDMLGIEAGGDPAKAGALFMELQQRPELLRARVVAWFDTFAGLPQVDARRIAAVGYCFGGMCVLELARSGADVKAVASFHGLLGSSQPAIPGTISGQVVAWCGGNDPYCSAEQVEAFRAEMTTAKISHQVTVFSEGAHGFTDVDADAMGREGVAYDALSHAVSWAGTSALLNQSIGG